MREERDGREIGTEIQGDSDRCRHWTEGSGERKRQIQGRRHTDRLSRDGPSVPACDSEPLQPWLDRSSPSRPELGRWTAGQVCSRLLQLQAQEVLPILWGDPEEDLSTVCKAEVAIPSPLPSCSMAFSTTGPRQCCPW